ncbi:uncharacterized protein FIBRA_05146 [Fibroporia radiculosa]|uniref:tripeptidyl-peptidase II n=1 Tax=Fibroporia radiculosa TaxID=599839 RepID=J4H3C4_9APHY|nr:uncharacterized protein FIBRA_05146 [Fibroporia radiculosa]CCM03029.1 predicted protein [Fibroporia radiculosa]
MEAKREAPEEAGPGRLSIRSSFTERSRPAGNASGQIVKSNYMCTAEAHILFRIVGSGRHSSFCSSCVQTVALLEPHTHAQCALNYPMQNTTGSGDAIFLAVAGFLASEIKHLLVPNPVSQGLEVSRSAYAYVPSIHHQCRPESTGKPLARNLQVHESRGSVPKGFSLDGPAPDEELLSLRMALVQNDMNGLLATLEDISMPSSPNYGQHLSKAEVEQFVAPSSQTIDTVNAWFTENNINATTINSAGDWLAFSMLVGQANNLFGANFSIFTHNASGKKITRTLSYSIPSYLKGHVELVHPTVTFVVPPAKSSVTAQRIGSTGVRRRSTDAEPSACEEQVDPACLQTLYGIPTTPATQSSNLIGVTGYGEEWANEADLAQFLQEFRPDVSENSTFPVYTIDGGINDQDPGWAGFEANLDTQYTAGIATGVPIEFLSVGSDITDGVFGFWDSANFFLTQDEPPTVITTSYGTDEDDVGLAVAYNLCNTYAQLSALGTTVLFSSGDGGVTGTQTDDSCTYFEPSFPATCPYVTSVGATTGANPETAAYFSSGGFSNYWGVPSFQSSAVSGYLSDLGDTNAGLYNASGRGFPDVSAQGINFVFIADTESWNVNGTSCSSPTFAAVVALLNDRLLAAGKSTLGWLNPLLYSTAASALNDITTGDNPGCGTNGFPATTGWDPVTGLGTPNFDALLSALGV